MRVIFFLTLLLSTLGVYSQTQPNLPPGTAPYSTNLFRSTDGSIWTGKAGSYTNLGSKQYVDSLSSIGYTREMIDSIALYNYNRAIQRGNHVGTQPQSTVVNLVSDLASKEDLSNKSTTLNTPNDTKYPTTKAVADAIAAIPEPVYPVTSVNGKTGDVIINKSDVGLGDVDNTSDIDKPISTATATALDDKVDKIGTSSIQVQQTLGVPAVSTTITPNDGILINGASGTSTRLHNYTPGSFTIEPTYSGSTGRFTFLNNGNLTIENGQVFQANAPVDDAHLTNKKYVDDSLVDKVDKSTTITGSGGITVGGSLSSGSVSLGVNDTYFNNRYLRKDIDDNNGDKTLTVGKIISPSAEFDALKMESLAVGTNTDEILVVDSTGVVKKKSATSDVNIGVANSGGTNQFTLGATDVIRFAGSGDTDVSFNPTTKTVTINSIPGAGGGGAVTSFNGRTGGVTSQAGDYSTTMVTEGDNLYFTEPRVRLTPLTGLSLSTSTPVVDTDNILQAFGKLQAQSNSKAASNRTLTVSGTAGRVIVSGGEQDLTQDREWAVDLSPSGVTAGTFTKVTVDTYGRVTSGSQAAIADIPSLQSSLNNKANTDGTNATGTWPVSITGSSTALRGTATGTEDGYAGTVRTTGLNTLLGYDVTTGIYKYTKEAVNEFLGIPSGGETLQSVLDRGNIAVSNMGLINTANNIRLDFFGSWEDQFGFALRSVSADNSATRPLLLNPDGGNVGIGLNNPQYPLSVNGVISGDSFGLRYTDGLVYNGLRLGSNKLTSEYWNQISSSPSNVAHKFLGFDGVNDVDLLSIYNNGGITVNGTIYSAQGNSSEWSQAYSWGNHATQGYTKPIDFKTFGGESIIGSGDIPITNDSRYIRKDANDSWSAGRTTTHNGNFQIASGANLQALTGSYVTLAGTTDISGLLTTSSTGSIDSRGGKMKADNPIDDDDVATKEYVDNASGGSQNLQQVTTEGNSTTNGIIVNPGSLINPSLSNGTSISANNQFFRINRAKGTNTGDTDSEMELSNSYARLTSYDTGHSYTTNLVLNGNDHVIELTTETSDGDPEEPQTITTGFIIDGVNEAIQATHPITGVAATQPNHLVTKSQLDNTSTRTTTVSSPTSPYTPDVTTGNPNGYIFLIKDISVSSLSIEAPFSPNIPDGQRMTIRIDHAPGTGPISLSYTGFFPSTDLPATLDNQVLHIGAMYNEFQDFWEVLAVSVIDYN